MAALRKAADATLGKLQHDEILAKSLIADKLEQSESGDLRADDLQEGGIQALGDFPAFFRPLGGGEACRRLAHHVRRLD